MSNRASRTLYVGNLPGDIREREVEDLFYKYGRIAHIDLKVPPRPPGYAFVEFEDARDAEDAIRGRDGYDFDGHRLRVELAHGGRGHTSSSDRYSSHGGGGGSGGGRGGRGVSRRSEYRVLVSGLPSSASWQDLKIMWAEAMETADREHLWPQLVHGFKDLSRLKLQDEVILSDAERLRMTQSNVKMLQRHFQADTLPWIERMRQKEQGLQSCLLGVMRIVEALEGKGCRLLLMKGEVELAEKLACYHQTVERIWSRAFSKGTKPGYDISCSSEFYWWWWLRLSFGINENTQSESC